MEHYNLSTIPDKTAQKNIQNWLEGPYDEESKKQILETLEKNPLDLVDPFYKSLSFGTGGLRGIMGVGTNRMNTFTIGATTQGLANYLKKAFPETHLKVFISFDCRNNSPLFAKTAARILAKNGIEVFIFRELRPTPLLSYACREKKCNAGIMITASHNPKAYNGYKAYWQDGGQVLPPHDISIVEEAAKISSPSDIHSLEENEPESLIHWITNEIDLSYINQMKTLAFTPHLNQEEGKNLKIVYTPLNGTGSTIIPTLLKESGFSSFFPVEEQMNPDGNFPTTPSPNPENPKALTLGMALLKKESADLLIATDPDADRMGVAFLTKDKKEILLTGNEIASLLLYHILSHLKETNKLPKNGAIVKTIVTTELLHKIASSFGIQCENVLTGFKYIAEKIELWEKAKDTEEKAPQFIFGAEESYGYLYNTFARDKDACLSSLLIAEAALELKLKGKNLLDQLLNLYKQFGFSFEKVFSLDFEDSKASYEKMEKGMNALRASPPFAFSDGSSEKKVVQFQDFLSKTNKDLLTGKISPINLPESNVLLFKCDDGSKIILRPSGTEPKIKIYLSLQEALKEESEEALQEATNAATKKSDVIFKFLSSFF